MLNILVFMRHAVCVA